MTCSWRVSLLAGLLALAPAALRGQEEEAAVKPSQGTGTHVFRRVLHEMGFTPLHSFQPLSQSPEESILVVLGDLDWLRGMPTGWLTAFVQRGGAVLLATDRGLTGQELLEEIALLSGVAVVGDTVLSPGADFRYHGHDFCPLLRPERGRSRAPVFRNPRGDEQGPLEVASNLPSRLRLVTRRLPVGVSPVAWLPPGSEAYWAADEAMWSAPLREQDRLFGVAGERGKGRFLLLADHSLFINTMMLPGDNGNVEFASNCMEWLRDGPSGPRRQVLFLEEGQINPTFEVPLVDRPLPELSDEELRALATRINPALAHLEDRDLFNSLTWSVLERKRLTPQRVGRIGLMALTIALAVYLIYRVTSRGRQRPEQAPALRRALRRHEPAAPLAQMRLGSQLQQGSLWESGRQLAQAVFARAGLVSAAEGPPRVRAGGGLLWRWRVRRRVRRLWRLAHGTRPRPISPRAWPRLLEGLREVEQELADGSLTLQPRPVPAGRPPRPAAEMAP